MAVGASAQDATDPVEETVTWKASDGAPEYTVELKNSKEELVIKAELLNNTSKGSKPEDIGAGVWIYNKGGYWTCSDKNGLEVRFTPLTDGTLSITLAAAIAKNKNINMFLNDDINNTMDATYVDPKEGVVKIPCGINLENVGYPDGIPSNSVVSYGIKAGNTYNFYCNGTKWRFGGFSFTPGEVEGGVDEARKVVYVTGNADEDYALMSLQGDSRLDITPLNASDDATLEDLQAYEVVVVSNNVAPDSKIVPVLKSAIAYQPMVNLNAALYEAWGLGKAVASEAQSVNMTEDFANDETFVSIANGDALLSAGTLSTIELGDYFANDAVVATIDGKVAIHRHNAGRNTYINVPMDAACIPTFDAANVIFGDLTEYAAKTKKGVIATTTPKIAQVNSHMETTVTITAAAGAVIHYTTDGTEPTEASAVYTEPLVLHDAATIKALATLDGYLTSAVASLDAVIMSQVAAPTFSMTQDETSTTVEIQCAEATAEIFYSYREFTDPTMAQKYEGPITLSQEPTIIYAMATAENCVNSNIAYDYVAIKNLNANTIRMDTVSHFSASEAAWLPEGQKCAFYYWGNKAWSHYSDEIDHYEDGVDADNNPVQVPVYKPSAEAVKEQLANDGTETDWRFVSAGQVIVLENGAALDGVGDGVDGNTLAGRYADTAEDLIGGLSTKGFLSFKGVVSGDPNTAAIESTKAFKAPFDVVVYLGNGSGGTRNAELQISTDGKTWTKLGDLKVATAKRYIKKTRLSVNEAGDYYVRVANAKEGLNVGDIYILNNGEVSQKYDPTSGIEDVEVAEVEVVRTEIYNISGMLMPEMIQGINIVRTYYSDGSVKTTKVLNR